MVNFSKKFTVLRALIVIVLVASVGTFLLIRTHASPTTYYVTTGGSDSANGSQSTPWRTVGKGMAAMSAGDTLMVGGGTYNERIQTSVNPGTSSAPITMKAVSGQRPVISGLFWVSGANYWTFDGINVTWSSADSSSEHMVKMTGGTGWRITNAEIWGARSYAGILVAGTPSGWKIDHNYIHDTYASNSTNQDHLIYVNGGTGGGTIERNIFANSSNGRGVKVGPPSGGSSGIGYVTIRYNTFYDNTGPSNIQLSYGATGNTIYRNIMVKSGASNITAYNLNGSGNVAYDNIGWQSSAVLDSDPNLVNKGGNIMADPGLNLSTFQPSSAYAAYGRYAPGDDNTTPPPPPPPPSTTLAAPTGLTASAASSSKINLSWSTQTGVSSFDVYRGTSKIANVVAVSGATSQAYSDSTGLSPATSYSYYLIARNSSGASSPASTKASATTSAAPVTVDGTAPSVPSGVSATAYGTSQIGLKWTASTDNVGVTGYNIYRGTSTTPIAKVGAVTAFTDNSVAAATKYSYQVEAFDAASNKSAKSVLVSATTGALSTDTTAPTLSITSPASGATVTGTVAVNASASDNVAVAKVEFSIDNLLKATSTTSPYTYSWNVTGLVGLHTVSVRAVDGAGLATVKSITVTTNSVPAPTLSAPSGLTAQAVSSTQINLSWQAVTAATSYDVYRSTGTANATKIGTATSSTSYGDAMSLSASTSYSYYLIARDANGNSSSPSTTAKASTLASPTTGNTPAAGTGSLTGRVKNVRTNKSINGAKVVLKLSSTKTVTAYTNSSGVYYINSQPPGSYVIVYSASGYQTNNDNVSIIKDYVKTKNKALTPN